jgi:hypothetical protein
MRGSFRRSLLVGGAALAACVHRPVHAHDGVRRPVYVKGLAHGALVELLEYSSPER